MSIETLHDLLLLLHDECAESTLCREKNFADFVETRKRGVRGRIGALFCIRIGFDARCRTSKPQKFLSYFGNGRI